MLIASEIADRYNCCGPAAANPLMQHAPRCKGTGCMAWRVGSDTTTGYCGLAGVPVSITKQQVLETHAEAMKRAFE